MRKLVINEHRLFFNIVLMLFILLILTISGFEFYQNKNSLRNEKKAEQILSSIDTDKNLSYISTDQLEQLLTYPGLSNQTLGQIYQKLSDISYLTNKKAQYASYIASSIYYYKLCEDDVHIAEIYNQYMGRLYESGGFKAARQLMDDLNEYKPIDSFHDKDVVSAYYLGYADLQEMLGEYDSAKSCLQSAKDTLPLIADDHYQIALAKYHLLSSRLALLQGDIQQADDLIKDYSVNDTLQLPKGNMFVYCDFTLPYCELQSKILLLQGHVQKAISYANRYLRYCKQSNFYMMEYRMLGFLVEHKSKLPQNALDRYTRQYQTLSEQNLSYLADEYCGTLIENLSQSQNSHALVSELHKRAVMQFKFCVFTLLLILILFTLFRTIIFFTQIDHLTQLLLRSAYEKKRIHMEKWKIPYHLLILDIDDFKAINDTYGHETGDQVLKNIGAQIRAALPEHCSAYRYGGEEICIILPLTEAEAQQQAEDIRHMIAHIDWTQYIQAEKVPTSITVSGGLSYAKEGRNPFRVADHLLYHSKQNGKNQITFERLSFIQPKSETPHPDPQ